LGENNYVEKIKT